MWKSVKFNVDRVVRIGSGHGKLESSQLLPRPAYHVSAVGPARRNFRFQSSVKTTKDQKENELDRHSLRPERSEAVLTGTDAEVGSESDAYDPRSTSPDSELHEAEDVTRKLGKTANPLEVSGANKDVSRTWDPADGKARNLPKAEASGRRASPKGGVVNRGEKSK